MFTCLGDILRIVNARKLSRLKEQDFECLHYGMQQVNMWKKVSSKTDRSRLYEICKAGNSVLGEVLCLKKNKMLILQDRQAHSESNVWCTAQ